ncbi:MAG: chain-length determining protein [Tannerellaceae bacterium]|jgi:uncharacterized protein involved in exopolysaccharide biosynthesis|nr:chain-length determining protein [Tannerellaceae bacterium]
METNQAIREESRERDMIELAQTCWKERKFIALVCGIAVVVGLAVIFSLPAEYRTVIKLAPEETGASRGMSHLGGLAAMTGVNLNTTGTTDAISPVLYPDVVRSIPFNLKLFPLQLSVGEAPAQMTLYDYMLHHQKKAWWSRIIRAPLNLAGWIKGLFSEKGEADGAEANPFRLTKNQERVIRELKERVVVSADKKTMAVSVSVSMQDPEASAVVARVVVENLQEYVTDYRTQKAKQDCAFTREAYEEAKAVYYKAQKASAAFEDANKHIISAGFRTELERLRNEMLLAFNVYNSLAQKLEQDKLRVRESTPVYTVIEPPTIPLEPYSPSKVMILSGMLILAFFGSIGYIQLKRTGIYGLIPTRIGDG